MISKFDSIYESILNEMMPMSFDDYGAVEGVIDTIVGNIMAARGNQGHWSKAFTSKKLKGVPDEQLENTMRGMVTDAVHLLFPENGNTYGPDLTKENFKVKIQDAIKKSFDVNSTYSKFLSDRFANKELLGKAKEVMEVVAAAGIEAAGEPSAKGGIKLTEVPKEAKTQKQINKNLRNYLASKGQSNKSVWSKTKEETTSPAPVATVSAEEEKEVVKEKVYFKLPGFESSDSKIQAAYDKIPDDKDMSWAEVVKLIGTSKAIEVFEGGGLKEETREVEPGEEEEIKDLELGDDEAPDLSRYLSDIDRGFSGFTRKGFGGDLSDF
jgi:hypothetical protein